MLSASVTVLTLLAINKIHLFGVNSDNFTQTTFTPYQADQKGKQSYIRIGKVEGIIPDNQHYGNQDENLVLYKPFPFGDSF